MAGSVLAFGLLLFLQMVPGSEPARREAQKAYKAGLEEMRLERFEEAVVHLRRAAELDPLLVSAHYNLGMAHMALKQYPLAVTAYEQSIEAVNRLGNLGDREREQRDLQNEDEIRELRQSVVQVQSGRTKDPATEQMIIRLEDRIRILEDMRGRGRDQQVEVPAELYLGLGSAWFRQNKFAEAEDAYRKAVKANPKLGPAHNNLAVIMMLSGRLKESRMAMEAAKANGFPVDPRFRADLEAREKAAAPK